MNANFYSKICIKSVQKHYTRYVQTKTRVRFAPSPTGFLHLGGLRTALYNYFFAKLRNGRFILRIEDTDQTRIVRGATESIIKDLEWAGIEIDEGPHIGGSFEPYIQSERLEIYRKEVKKLLENGSAYYCFCSERRLELLRKEANRARQVPKYDNKCRNLTPVQIAEKIAHNEKFCIRFKLTNFVDSVKDLVYNHKFANVYENEGDPVIIKSDGYPTYHFANVVDDHLMEITHVFRGVEWQISTAKHLLLYRAFGWKPPLFGHLPLLLNFDGSKLSKRQGDIQVAKYREIGILPQALINYVIQAGGGFSTEQQISPTSYTMAELISKFDISRINSNSGRLNPELLQQFNRSEIIKKTNDDKEIDKIAENVKSLVTKNFQKSNASLNISTDHVKNVLKYCNHRLTSLQDLVTSKFSFLWILPKTDVIHDLTKDDLSILIASLETQDFTINNLKIVLKDFSQQNNKNFSIVMKSLRSILSGLEEGPSVSEMMEMLGKKETLERLQKIKEKSTTS